MNLRTLLLSIFIGFFCSTLVYANTWHIRSTRAYLLKQPEFNSMRIQPLKRGEKVTELGKKGIWIKISASSGKGWISKFMLTKSPVIPRIRLVSQRANKSSRMRSRLRLRSMQTATGVKGLIASGKKRFETQSSDFERLALLEQIKISRQEALIFLLDYKEN